jgi:hypothetical protein
MRTPLAFAAAVLGLALLILLAGCVTLKPEAAHVEVVRNPNDVLPCSKVGTLLTSVSGWGELNLARENNEKDLRNRTAQLGGDTLLILQERRERMAPTTLGQAYRCR